MMLTMQADYDCNSHAVKAKAYCSSRLLGSWEQYSQGSLSRCCCWHIAMHGLQPEALPKLAVMYTHQHIYEPGA